MANRCICKLSLVGSKEVLERLVKDFKSKDSNGYPAWDLRRIPGYDENSAYAMAPLSGGPWFGFHAWSVILEPTWSGGAHRLEAGFETKWCPPTDWLRLLQGKYQAFGSLSYFERGCGFCGELTLHEDAFVQEVNEGLPECHPHRIAHFMEWSSNDYKGSQGG